MPNRIIVVRDQETHEFIQFPIYGDRWDKALSCLSGEGNETQLVNAMGRLGFDIFEQKENLEEDDTSAGDDDDNDGDDS